MTPLIAFSLGGLIVLAIMCVACVMAFIQGYNAGWQEVCDRLGAKVKPQPPHWLDDTQAVTTKPQSDMPEDAFYA